MPLDFVDTSSEYVLVPDNSILDVGSADFCCMYWFRATTNGDSIFTKGRNTGGNPGWQIRMNGSGVLLATFSDGSGGFGSVCFCCRSVYCYSKHPRSAFGVQCHLFG